jgi:hypothetical protein
MTATAITQSFCTTMLQADIKNILNIVGVNDKLASPMFDPMNTALVKSSIVEKFPGHKVIVNFFGKPIGAVVYTEKSKNTSAFKPEELEHFKEAVPFVQTTSKSSDEPKSNDEPKGKIVKYFEGIYLQIPDIIQQFNIAPNKFEQEKKKLATWLKHGDYKREYIENGVQTYTLYKLTPYNSDIIRADIALLIMLFLNDNALNVVLNSVFALTDSPKFMIDLAKHAPKKNTKVGYVIYGVEKTTKNDKSGEHCNYKLIKYADELSLKKNTIYTVKIATVENITITMTGIEKLLGITDSKAKVADKSKYIPTTKEDFIAKLKMIPSEIPDVYNAPELINSIKKQKEEMSSKRSKSGNPSSKQTDKHVKDPSASYIQIKQKGVVTENIQPAKKSLLDEEEELSVPPMEEPQVSDYGYAEGDDGYEYEYEEVEVEDDEEI